MILVDDLRTNDEATSTNARSDRVRANATLGDPSTRRNPNQRSPSRSPEADLSVQRLLDILTIMERFERENDGSFALCDVAAEFMALDGASIALMSDDDELIPLCTSNSDAGALMDLERTLGEGPAIDASRGDAIEDLDLLRPSASNWETYRPEAIALGARAVFGFPLRLGAIRFGALSLFRNSAGPLDSGQSADAYLMASVIGRAILSTQAGVTSESLVGELNGASMLDFRVHQAAGMVAVQGSMTVKDALVLMRAHAFGIGCQLSELADSVVSRTARWAPESREWIDERSGGPDGR